MVPITGRASSFLVFLEFSTKNKRVGGTKHNNRLINLHKVIAQGYNILHRLQVHHLTITFTMHNINNIYEHYIYIHTYIYEFSSQLYCFLLE